MPTLTPDGQRLVQELARRHGFGEEAISHMLDAVAAGHGRMAQFSHPEFGGSGQWMSGGMLMLGSLFDQELKGRVGALCKELAGAPDAILASSTSSGSNAWWPSGLGTPSASGSQGAMRYAYFADACRLAVEAGGEVCVRDTLDHRIGGFSQQQGGTGSLSMSSQHGAVELETLPVVSDEDVAGRSSAQLGPGTAPVPDAGARAAPSVTAASTDGVDAADADPLRLIERLGRLHEQGFLTSEEFSAKKQELLQRL